MTTFRNPSKKSIVVLFDGTLESSGGAERFAINLLKIYEVIGLKPIMIMLGRKLRILKSDKSVIIEVPTIGFLKRSIAILNIIAFKRVLQIVKSIDIIHLLYCESPIQLLITLLGKFWGKSIISSPLASLSFLFHHNKLKALISIPLIAIKLVISKLANIVHVASVYDYRYLRSLNKSIVLIPHSFNIASDIIDSFNVRDTTQAIEIEKNLPLHASSIKLCFLGRFSEDKGSLITLEALRMLRHELGVDACLIIIGPRVFALESLVKYAKKYGRKALEAVLPHVYVVGYLPEKIKCKLLKVCHVGLIPSMSDAVEAFSIALSEFNAFKIPVVASSIGALKHRMKPYAGILVKPKDPKALAEGIIQALSLKKLSALPDVITFDQEVSLWRKVLKRLLSG